MRRRGYSVIDPRNCYKGGQSTNCRINSRIRERLLAGSHLSLWICAMDKPDDDEERLIHTLDPPWNL